MLDFKSSIMMVIFYRCLSARARAMAEDESETLALMRAIEALKAPRIRLKKANTKPFRMLALGVMELHGETVDALEGARRKGFIDA